MNKELNLIKILKDCPKGIILYSPICGEVEFISISRESINGMVIKGEVDADGDEYCYYPITFLSDGRYIDYPDGECLLFPSKDNQDWSKFEIPSNDLLIKRKLIEDACKWLRKNTDDYIERDTDEMRLRLDFLIRDFKKAMEE